MTFNLKGNALPKEENFKKWGVQYLCQLVGFVERERDDSFTKKFFNFLRNNKSLYSNKNDKKKFGKLLYNVFVDNITIDRNFASELCSFIIFEFQNEKWFNDFLSLSYNLAAMDSNATCEYFRIRDKLNLSYRGNDRNN